MESEPRPSTRTSALRARGLQPKESFPNLFLPGLSTENRSLILAFNWAGTRNGLRNVVSCLVGRPVGMPQLEDNFDPIVDADTKAIEVPALASHPKEPFETV